MIRQYTITERERGKGMDYIEICTTHCPYPDQLCNGECDYFKAKAKELRQTKRLKKNIIVF